MHLPWPQGCDRPLSRPQLPGAFMTTTNPDTTVNGVTEAAPEPKLAERAAQLKNAAKAEQAKLRARETDRAERVALEARAKAAEEKAARLEAFEKEVSSDAIGFLQRRGVTAQSIAERVVKEGTPDAKLEELAAKYQKLEEERAAERKAYEERVAK